MKKNVVIIGIGNVGFSLLKKLYRSNDTFEIVVIDRMFPKHFEDFIEKNKAEKDESSIQQIALHDKLSRIDVLVCTVGTLSKATDFNDYRKEFYINFFGNVTPIRTLLPKIKKNENSRVIILSSISGNIAPTDAHSYAPSKWALESFSNALRKESLDEHIYVDVVRPTNIVNKYSEVFDIKKGIDVEQVVQKILPRIQLALNNKSVKGKSFFVPKYLFLFRIVDRVFPSILNYYFGLKPNFKRKKRYQECKRNHILITDGISKLGRELAFLYAKRAKKISLLGNNDASLDRLKKDIKEVSDCTVEVHTTNLSIDENFNMFIEENKDIDIVINTTDKFLSKSVKEMSTIEYKSMLGVNFFIPIRLIQTLVNRKVTTLKIINVNTREAIYNDENSSAYAASKSALWSYIKSLRRQHGMNIHILEVIINKVDINEEATVSSKKIALKIKKAEQKGKDRILISKRLYFYLLLESFSRPLFYKIFKK